jgi:outer membrane protein assembly factor BamE
MTTRIIKGNTMRKLLIICALTAALSSCSQFVQKMDIDQGNIVSQEQVARIHIGMTETQVKDILGQPILINVFDKSRLDYVYSYKPGHGVTSVSSMTVIIKNGKVAEITGNLYSQFVK